MSVKRHEYLLQHKNAHLVYVEVSTVKEVPNVGKFEVDVDGNVTFTPNKQFKGETPELELTRVDDKGTPVTFKYQAVVREVVPTGTDTSTTGKQGQVQT